jgi:hypothetical protein
MIFVWTVVGSPRILEAVKLMIMVFPLLKSRVKAIIDVSKVVSAIFVRTFQYVAVVVGGNPGNFVALTK